MKGTLHEGQYTFLIKSRSLLLKMKNVAGKVVEKNQNINFMIIIFFF